MAQFDDLVAKYRNLSYGRLAGTNPSAVNSLLNTQDRGTNSITSPNYFGNIPIEQQQYIETPSGLIGQNEFRIDSNTGIPVFQTPTSEAINQGIEMSGGTVGSGVYDQDIDYGDPGYAGVEPVTGNIPSNVSTTTINDRGGNGPNQDPFSGRYESFGDQTFSIDEDGNIKPVTGTPFTTPLLGLLSGIGKLVPGEEARRFEGLDENTQRQLFGLLDDETKNALAGSKYNMNVDNNVTRDYLNRDIISQLTPEQQKELLKTDVERDIVNKRSGYGLFGIGSPSEAERAKALQAQQNARDLQKQAEKERQARETRNSRPSTGGASRDKQQANRDLGASRGRQTGGGQKLGR